MTIILGTVNHLISQKSSIEIVAGFGSSQITSKFLNGNSFIGKYRIGGKLGMAFRTNRGKRTNLGIELNWIKIEGNEARDDFIIFYAGSAATTGIASDKRLIHRNYIGVPTYISFGTRFKASIGYQLMLLLTANSNYAIEGIYDGKPFSSESEMMKFYSSNFDHGPIIKLTYRTKKRISAFVDFYLGISDTSDKSMYWVRKNRQVNIGVHYNIRKELL